MVLAIGDDLDQLPGMATQEPVFGLAAKWVPAELREHVALASSTVVDRSSVITTHMAEVVRVHAAQLLSREDEDAQLALGVYIHRLRAGIAAMVASLGGLDALVFTGGVGEHADRVRELACAGLEHLGVGALGSQVRVLTVRAREDLEIRRQVLDVLTRS